jgi:hypothetical protein
MKTCLIKQPQGIGDIFFTQKIAYHFRHLGYRVIWPVVPVYKSIKEYMTNFEYPCIEDDFEHKDLYESCGKDKIFRWKEGSPDEIIVVPTNHLSTPEETPVMFRKFALVGLDYSDWADWFNFKRNTEKENRLYYDVLGLKDNEEYIFVNRNIGTPPHDFSRWDVPVDSKIEKQIDSSFENGFTLFDWCKVLENASEFHVLETSITYLIEKINTKASVYNMFSRNLHNDFSEYKEIYKNKSWNWRKFNHRRII